MACEVCVYGSMSCSKFLIHLASTEVVYAFLLLLLLFFKVQSS